MAKQKDPNNFKFPETTTTTSFAEFLVKSQTTETLTTIEPVLDKEVQIVQTDSVFPHVLDSKELNLDLVANQEADTVVKNVLPTENFLPVSRVSDYASKLLNNINLLSGKQKRISIAEESARSLRTLHESLTQIGIRVTFTHLLDFIVHTHVKELDQQFKAMKKGKLKVLR